MDKKMYEYFKVIGEINNIINTSKTIDEVLKRSLKLITATYKVDSAIIWYKDSNEILHPYYAICPFDLTNKECKPFEGVLGAVYASQGSKAILNYAEEPREDINAMYPGMDITSYVCTPISNNMGKVGAVEYIKTSGEFNDDVANILEMITMLAMIKINDEDKFAQVWENKEILISIRDAEKEFVNGNVVTKVLKGINLDIYAGEFVVLLGESGCGKSTLLNAVGGMDTLTSGSIEFKDIDLSKAKESELTEYRRNHIGFIFQSYNLMPNLNVKENLDLIAELVKEPMDSLEALDRVGLKDRAKNYPSQLSGGQQQRVSIARALIKNPTIIMADEPTAALDYETSVEVLTALEDVYHSGKTLLMVTHNEEIAKMANRVVRFRGGKVYEILVNRNPLHAKDLVW